MTRKLIVGDRVSFAAPNKHNNVGTIIVIDDTNVLTLYLVEWPDISEVWYNEWLLNLEGERL